MENNRKLSASCVVMKDNEVLLVKHTYGAARGRFLILGGFGEEREMPQKTAEREVLEETGITIKANELVAVRFTEQEGWCIFAGTYVSGVPASDGQENDEAIFMPVDEALRRDNVVETTKEILKSILRPDKSSLEKSSFVNANFDGSKWQIFF